MLGVEPMLGVVGAFALFVIVQQFRNPGRPLRRYQRR
jgi:hypothetical protein